MPSLAARAKSFGVLVLIAVCMTVFFHLRLSVSWRDRLRSVVWTVWHLCLEHATHFSSVLIRVRCLVKASGWRSIVPLLPVIAPVEFGHEHSLIDHDFQRLSIDVANHVKRPNLWHRHHCPRRLHTEQHLV